MARKALITGKSNRIPALAAVIRLKLFALLIKRHGTDNSHAILVAIALGTEHK